MHDATPPEVVGEDCLEVSATLYLPRRVVLRSILQADGKTSRQNGIFWSRWLSEDWLRAHGVTVVHG